MWWNWWAYDNYQYLPAILWLGFRDFESHYVYKVKLRSCWDWDAPYCLKKFRLEFLNQNTGWTIPTITTLQFSHSAVQHSKTDGIIELSESRKDIYVYFKPIDASEARLTIFDSFDDSKNTVLNGIKFYRAGIDYS